MLHVQRILFWLKCYVRSHQIHLCYGVPAKDLGRLTFEMILIATLVSYQNAMLAQGFSADERRHMVATSDILVHERLVRQLDLDVAAEINRKKQFHETRRKNLLAEAAKKRNSNPSQKDDDDDHVKGRDSDHSKKPAPAPAPAPAPVPVVPSTTATDWNSLMTLVAAAPAGDPTYVIDLGADIAMPTGVVSELSQAFDGTLNGHGHTVSGVVYPLFNVVSSTGQINNVNIISSLNMPAQGALGVGALVRTNHGLISGCSVSGSVMAVGSNYVGGLVGWNFGTIDQVNATANLNADGLAGGIAGVNSSGTISNSSVSAQILITGSFAGGISGYMTNGAQILKSTAPAGSVSAGYFAGGLSGYLLSAASVSSSSTAMSVSADMDAGGAVGGINDPGVVVSHCVATGSVSAPTQSAGGFIGKQLGGVISASSASGAVNGGAIYVGGFAGYVGGGAEIVNSFSVGAVSAPGYRIGGFVGSIEDAASLVHFCYAAGSVSAPLNQDGGFAGFALSPLDNVVNAIVGQPLAGLVLSSVTSSLSLNPSLSSDILLAYQTVFVSWDQSIWDLSNSAVLPALK